VFFKIEAKLVSAGHSSRITQHHVKIQSHLASIALGKSPFELPLIPQYNWLNDTMTNFKAARAVINKLAIRLTASLSCSRGIQLERINTWITTFTPLKPSIPRMFESSRAPFAAGRSP
jgi:hypothetical protein